MRDIRLGGLTPPIALVRAIIAETSLPVRVMVRENAGYGTDAAELVPMCRAAAAFAAVGIDGLVVGFARDGQLPLDELEEVLHAAPHLPATFHRAFDSLKDPLRAIDVLAGVPQIDRILTSGSVRRASLPEASTGARRAPLPGAPIGDEPSTRCARLREYSGRAGSRLTIIAGGGVDEEMLTAIARTECVREVHVGRAARDGRDQEAPVTAARVRRSREILNRLP